MLCQLMTTAIVYVICTCLARRCDSQRRSQLVSKTKPLQGRQTYLTTYGQLLQVPAVQLTSLIQVACS